MKVPCPACGKRIGPGSHHCLYCGADVSGRLQAPAGSVRSPRRRSRGHIRSNPIPRILGPLIFLAVIVVGVVIGLRACGKV